MADGRVHTSHPSSTPLGPPSALTLSYRNHQKSLAYFSHLVPLVLFFFIKRQSKKIGGMAQCFLPKYTLLPNSLRKGACEQIIRAFKGGLQLHVYKRRPGYCVLC